MFGTLGYLNRKTPGVAPLSGPACLKECFMGKLTGKKLLLLGERDGVPSPAMESVFKNSGAEIVFSATECFV